MRLYARKHLTLAFAGLLLSALAACSDSESPTDGAPDAPGSVTAAATSPTAVRVTWSQVSSAESYQVDRAAGTGSFSQIATGLTGTFYDDTGLQPSTAYRYQVRSVKGTAASSNSTAANVTTMTPGAKVATVTGIPLSRTFYADTTYVL